MTDMMAPIYDDYDDSGRALIKVIGVGGGGGNTVNHMVECLSRQNEDADVEGFSFEGNYTHGEIVFYAVNTDAKALRKSLAKNTIQIGTTVSRGLGAGGRPSVGKTAAEEDIEAMKLMLEGADMVFITAGMGGGTGTGAAPVVAQAAKELGILTVAVVTTPFTFEGSKRMGFAEAGLKELSKYVDSLIIIPNAKLLKVLPRGISMLQAFAEVNDVLRNAVTGISDMITSPGLIGVDFADVRTVMSEMGRAMMGTGVAQGSTSDGRAEKAAQAAIANPLLEDVDLSGAKGVLVNITAGMDLGLDEFETIGDSIRAFAAEDATVIVGTSLIQEMENEIRVTIVATGIGEDAAVPQPPQPPHGPINPPVGNLTGGGSIFGNATSTPVSGQQPWQQTQLEQQNKVQLQDRRPATVTGGFNPNNVNRS